MKLDSTCTKLHRHEIKWETATNTINSVKFADHNKSLWNSPVLTSNVNLGFFMNIAGYIHRK